MMTALTITQIAPYEFEAIIKRVVREVMTEINNSPKAEEVFLTRKQTAARLGISLPTLHDYTTSGKLQSHRIGGSVRYKLTEIEAALQSRVYSVTKKTGE